MIDIHHVQLPGTRVGRYESPPTLDEALAAMAVAGRTARPIAGGTDLMVELDRGEHGDVDVLIDLSRIPSLGEITVTDVQLRLGALVTHNQVVASADCQEFALALAQASLEVGSPPLRNRATVAGNVVTASPANDTISALMALDAAVEIGSVRGQRQCSLADFITGFRTVDLARDELVTAIVVPLPPPGQRSIFVKLGLRRAQAISVVHLAAAVTIQDGVVTAAKLALGSVGPTVFLVADFEAALLGHSLGAAEISNAAAAAVAAATPIDDLRSTADYRQDLIGTMTKRALEAISRDEQAQTWPTDPALLWGAAFDGSPVVKGADDVTLLTPDDEVTAMIDGREVSHPGAVGVSMLDWLRHAGINGVKEGCAEGECGACVVDLDGAAVMSCLIPAGRASGSSITTVQGLSSDDELHPIQQAFIETGAAQCGFCTPGFLISCSKLIEETGQPSKDQVQRGLSGNICRCTGYRAIEAAIDIAATEISVRGVSGGAPLPSAQTQPSEGTQS